MYVDHSPEPRLTNCVLVIEEGDRDIEEVIETARDEQLTTEDGDGDEIFYIVFANEPRRVWDFTEKSLRQHFAKQKTKEEVS